LGARKYPLYRIVSYRLIAFTTTIDRPERFISNMTQQVSNGAL